MTHYFEEGKPHVVCQYIAGHQFVISVVCRQGFVFYFDIYGGGEATKSFLTQHLKERFRDWIVQFFDVKCLNGLISFDFIVDDASEEVFCVGCKPSLNLSIIKRHRPEQVCARNSQTKTCTSIRRFKKTFLL